jgi:flagellar biosynthesis/type III secretory pathway protein FliH
MPHEGPLDLVREHPEIAVELVRGTAGIDMASEPGARRVLDAMASPGVTGTDRLRMTAIILKLASDAARQLLAAMMTTSEYEKTFIEKIHDQGIAEGEARGEAKGKAEGKAEAVLRLLNAREITLSREQREQVASSTDSAQLDCWFDRAVTARTAAEVFAD